MGTQVKFDYSLTNGIVSEDEIKSMAKIAKDAKDVLVSKSGAGNDFLGWIDLPVITVPKTLHADIVLAFSLQQLSVG